MSEDHVHVYDTGVSLWAECDPVANKERLWRDFRSVVAMMYARGWEIHSDPEIDKHFPSLSSTTKVAHRGILRMLIELRGRVIQTTVYLDAVIDNPNGHRYDFYRLRHMNGEQRLRTILAMTAVVQKGFELGYVFGPELTRRRELSADLLSFVRDIAERRPYMDPLDDFNARWNFEGDWKRGGRFKRDETGWPIVKEYDQHGHNVDRDGVPLRNGQVRYARDYNTHRVIRGTAYTNMNEMWMLDTGVGRRYVHRRELFSCDDPSALRGRHFPRQAERLEREINNSLKAKDFLRVSTLSGVRARIEA